MVAIFGVLLISAFANLLVASLSPGKMETIKSQPNTDSSCLLISKRVFPRNIPNSDFDTLLFNTQSIIFDFYSKLFKNDFERGYNAKSRHFMILKILTAHLNLSINACGEDQYPTDEDKLDISFAVMPYDLGLTELSKVELIHSRENYVIKFASVKTQDVSSLFLSLVKPIGMAVFLASCCLLIVLTLTIWLVDSIDLNKFLCNSVVNSISKLVSKSGSVTSVSVLNSLFFKALLGQCVSYRRTVEILGCNNTFRLAYLFWLLYCILITSAYNGNLLQQLMQPAETLSSQTFEDLLEDNRIIVGFQESRLGQVPDILQCLGREAKERFETFGKLLQKFYSRNGVSYPEHILDGKVNVMADDEVLQALVGTLERRYGITHYGIGRARIINPIFWSVSHTTLRKNDIIQTLKLLGSSGITDYHSWQQEVAEKLIAEKILQMFFGGIFSTDVDEEDKDEDIVEVKAKLYQKTQSRIKKLGLEIPGRTQPIKLRHYLVMWILLGIGFTTGVVSFIWETLISKN